MYVKFGLKILNNFGENVRKFRGGDFLTHTVLFTLIYETHSLLLRRIKFAHIFSRLILLVLIIPDQRVA